jgi:hypothetical protein
MRLACWRWRPRQRGLLYVLDQATHEAPGKFVSARPETSTRDASAPQASRVRELITDFRSVISNGWYAIPESGEELVWDAPLVLRSAVQ